MNQKAETLRKAFGLTAVEFHDAIANYHKTGKLPVRGARAVAIAVGLADD